MTDDLFDAMIDLKHLDLLRILDSTFTETPRLTRLIPRLCISLLDIFDCVGVTGEIMKAAASIRTLEYLAMQAPDGMSEETVIEFMKLLVKLPMLCQIGLVNIRVSDTAASILSRSKTLDAEEILSGVVISQRAMQIVSNRGIAIYNPSLTPEEQEL